MESHFRRRAFNAAPNCGAKTNKSDDPGAKICSVPRFERLPKFGAFGNGFRVPFALFSSHHNWILTSAHGRVNVKVA